MKERKSIRLILFALFCLFVLGGCSEVPVADDVNQSQANEIVSVLNDSGISAEASRDTGGRSLYSVKVKRGFYRQAVSLLFEKGLPREQEPTFTETIASRGLLPNSREIESLRIDHALAVQAEEMLRTHPAIAQVKVIVRMNFQVEGSKPGVSVVIQEKPGTTIDQNEIRQIVSRAVPGVLTESIFVSSAPPAAKVTIKNDEATDNVDGKVIRVPLTPFLGFWRVPEDDQFGLSLAVLVVLIVIGGVGGLVGYWAGYFQQSKSMMETNLPEITSRTLRLDRGRREITEL